MQLSRFFRGAIAAAGVAMFGGLLATLAERLVGWGGSSQSDSSYCRFLQDFWPDPPGGINLWCNAAAIGLIFALFVLSLAWLGRIAGEALEARARVFRRGEPRRVLIIGLSQPRSAETLQRLMDDAALASAAMVALPETDFSEKRGHLEAEGQHVPIVGHANPWQQSIRAMWYHGDKLRKVIVLPSDQSLEHFEMFKTYATGLFTNAGRQVEIDLVRDPSDPAQSFAYVSDDPDQKTRSYESYEYVDKGLRQAIAQARSEGFKDRHICVDATSGQKPFSIAAAILTLNSRIIFSYVNNAGLVAFYDVAIDVLGFEENR